jgi:hypothetical protein
MVPPAAAEAPISHPTSTTCTETIMDTGTGTDKAIHFQPTVAPRPKSHAGQGTNERTTEKDKEEEYGAG